MKYCLHLYRPEDEDGLDVDAVRVYFEKVMSVDVRANPLATVSREVETQFERIRIRDITKNFEEQPAENVEEVGHVLYDGLRAARVFERFIAKDERNRANLHLFFTNRLVGTYGEGLKYHARINIIGYPCVVSLPGVVEAPARPMEYYIARGRLQMADPTGAPMDDREMKQVLKEAFKDRDIDYMVDNDERLTEVVKGYVMQAVFYHVFREGFCEDKNCRLYNAHRQDEMINAQLGRPEFCEKHEAMKKSIKR